MINGCMNFVATAQYGILAVMAGPSMEDRNILSFRGMQIMAAATIITSIGAVPVITWLTPMIGQSMGYFIVATVFAIPFIYGVHRLKNQQNPMTPFKQKKVRHVCQPSL
jgi:hypothetical protein